MTKRGKAQTFDEVEFHELLKDVTDAQASKNNAQPAEVMRVAFLCAFYLGLRVQEIAGLRWDSHVFNDGEKLRTISEPIYGTDGKPLRYKNGRVRTQTTDVVWIGGDIGKYGRERTLPVPQKLKEALLQLHALGLEGPYVIPSGKPDASQGLRHRAHALKMRINRMYKALGMERGSTHSGRRSYITRLAQRANAYDMSIEDVRDLAGHSSIVTTNKYIDPGARQRDLVESIWS